ncbi:hypothetical protein ACSBR1_036937 [Camellia fascicularis]
MNSLDLSISFSISLCLSQSCLLSLFLNLLLSLYGSFEISIFHSLSLRSPLGLSKMAGHDLCETSSGPDSYPNRSTGHRNSRLSRKVEKEKGDLQLTFELKQGNGDMNSLDLSISFSISLCLSQSCLLSLFLNLLLSLYGSFEISIFHSLSLRSPLGLSKMISLGQHKINIFSFERSRNWSDIIWIVIALLLLVSSMQL